MTLKENPLTISLSFLVGFAVFIPFFVAVGIDLARGKR